MFSLYKVDKDQRVKEKADAMERQHNSHNNERQKSKLLELIDAIMIRNEREVGCQVQK